MRRYFLYTEGLGNIRILWVFNVKTPNIFRYESKVPLQVCARKPFNGAGIMGDCKGYK